MIITKSSLAVGGRGGRGYKWVLDLVKFLLKVMGVTCLTINLRYNLQCTYHNLKNNFKIKIAREKERIEYIELDAI